MTDAIQQAATVACGECGQRHRVPREPRAYHPTDHFLQRRHRRDPPPGVVAAAIERGILKPTDDPGLRLFAIDYHGERWGVKVSLIPEAFHSERTHRAVTVHPIE